MTSIPPDPIGTAVPAFGPAAGLRGSGLDRMIQCFASVEMGQTVCSIYELDSRRVGAELLFDVISTAYERSSVLVTTNLPFEEWTEVLGSEQLTGATLDRLTHRCTIVETGKESYRLRDARRRRRGVAGDLSPPTLDSGPVE